LYFVADVKKVSYLFRKGVYGITTDLSVYYLYMVLLLIVYYMW
jgi:hypothetical protein